MKLKLLAGVMLACAAFAIQANAQRVENLDTSKVYRIERATITSTRAGSTTPVPHSELNKKQIGQMNYGSDMPFLLQSLPSVVATSYGGTGMGYTGLSIRGTDATRINVTLDGVPMNDAESHGLFWVNVPDLAASLGSVQVQRGVGTSTNGAGAFGGSVNMLFDKPSQRAFGVLSLSGGSFGTRKETLSAGTGLLRGHWTLDVRLSDLHTDGYVRHSTADNRSWMARVGWQGSRTAIILMALGGKERSGLAWNGVTQAEIDGHGRRWNPLGIMRDGEYYDDQTDNYTQNHLHMRLFHALGDSWNLNAAVHYTRGDGYYEEYKNGWENSGENLVKYGLEGGESALVRRKMMDNWFGGATFSLDHKSENLEAAIGGAANRYDGDHFGRVMWVENYAAPLSPEHRYYLNRGVKDDANLYAKAQWQAVQDVYIYGDVQYRLINYRINGLTDRFFDNGTGQFSANVDQTFNFFNPKFGAFWRASDKLRVYASAAIAHREPPRNNYTDNARFSGNQQLMPRAERLLDFEVGSEWHTGRLTAGVNLYYMTYKDQMVLTGALNAIGEPLTDNIPCSYRAGIELTAGIRIAPWLRWSGNATLSRNRIRDFVHPLSGVTLRATPISLSPSLLAGSLFAFEHRGWTGALQTNYVGKQFVTNSGEKALSLNDYCITTLRAARTWGCAALGVEVNNLFNARYSSGGWGYYDGSDPVLGMFPQAGTNFLANLTLKW